MDNLAEYIQYHSNGEVKAIIISNEERTFTHNPNGPAVKTYTTDAVLIREEYYINGALHREDGPSIILYNKRGHIRKADWYYKGRNITGDVTLWCRKNGFRRNRLTSMQKTLLKMQLIESLRKKHGSVI